MRLASVLLLAACGTEYSPTGTGTGPDATQDLDGPTLYSENCQRCHGAGGDGSTTAPQIREPVRAYASYWVRNGRPDQMGFGQAMPVFEVADISDADLAKVYDYLDRAPRPTDGAGLYARFCANCHGAKATGGRVGVSIKGKGRDAQEEVRQGHGGTSYATRTKYMPGWSASVLSDAEVAAIASFLNSVAVN